MSDKVISLAARRQKRLGLSWYGMHGRPVNRPAYDAWIEPDGSLVMRFDPQAVDASKHGGSFTSAEDGTPTFTVRPAGHEIRIAADVARQWFDDMQSFGIASRRIAETRRGVYEWRCDPRGDGTYLVRHAHRRAVFEPFKPRPRKTMVGTGKIVEGVCGRFEERAHAMVAPSCIACRRVIQGGETAYHEQRNPGGRAWPGVVICSTCIKRTVERGVHEVTGAVESPQDGAQ